MKYIETLESGFINKNWCQELNFKRNFSAIYGVAKLYLQLYQKSEIYNLPFANFQYLPGSDTIYPDIMGLCDGTKAGIWYNVSEMTDLSLQF